MSAPQRELTLPISLVVAHETAEQRAERKVMDEWVHTIQDHAQRESRGKGRQLASEQMGPYQAAVPVTSKVRRREKRVAALNHDSTRDVIVTGPAPKNVGAVKVDEVPLGGSRVKPKWLKRAPRLTDGQRHAVERYRIVEGPALVGAPYPVRYPIITTADKAARAEKALREAAYKHSTGNSPDTITVTRYQESDADHHAARTARVLSGELSAKATRRAAAAVFGPTCPVCGLMVNGDHNFTTNRITGAMECE